MNTSDQADTALLLLSLAMSLANSENAEVEVAVLQPLLEKLCTDEEQLEGFRYAVVQSLLAAKKIRDLRQS